MSFASLPAGQCCATALKWAPLVTKKTPKCVLSFRGKAVSSFRRTVSMSVRAKNLTTQTQEKLFQVFPNSHFSVLRQEQSSSDLGKVVSFTAQAQAPGGACSGKGPEKARGRLSGSTAPTRRGSSRRNIQSGGHHCRAASFPGPPLEHQPDSSRFVAFSLHCELLAVSK